MNLIESKAELIPQKYDIQGVYEQIELAGRTSYKSEGRIQLDSEGRSTTAKGFVEMLEKAGHGAALEHGTVYLTIPGSDYGAEQAIQFYLQNQYSFVNWGINSLDTLKDAIDNKYNENNICYITTNYRVIAESGRKSDLKWISEPNMLHQPRYSIRFTLSRAIANEFVRHRVFSFLQESTRYVNYKDGLTIIKPVYYDDAPSEIQGLFDSAVDEAEHHYKLLIEHGAKPEQARDVLPLATKTELVMTGTLAQWNKFCELRCDKHAHPDAQKLANKVKKLLKIDE